MSKFFKELNRRNVIKSTLAFIVVSWVILQFITIILPIIEAPEWVLKLLTFLMLIGLPVWIFFSWVYEITPTGIKKTSEVSTHESITAQTNKRLNIIILVVLIIAIIVSFFIDSSPKRNNFTDTGTTSEKIIAVLLFNDMCEEDTQWFCDGVTEDIRTNLTRIGDIKVRSRKSVMQYKESDKTIPEIAKELGASYIIAGSLRRQNNKVRISAQLINANDEQLWSDNYDGELDDVLKIQNDISKKIVEQLKIVLTPEDIKTLTSFPTENIEAYQLVLKGRSLAENRTEDGIKTSIELYKKAIDLDPNYAGAYAEVANSYNLLGHYNYSDREESNNMAKDYIKKSLEIDQNAVRAHTTLANIYINEENWEKAKENFEKAISLNSDDATAHHHFALYYKAKPIPDKKNYLKQISIAHELDPFSIPINETRILALLDNDKPQEAKTLYNKNISRISIWQRDALKAKINSYLKKDWTEAIIVFKDALESDPNNPYLHLIMGHYYNGILNDDVNYLKHCEIAFQLDSTSSYYAKWYFDSLLDNQKYNNVFKLLNDDKLNNIFGSDGKNRVSYKYYLAIENYEKAMEYLLKYFDENNDNDIYNKAEIFTLKDDKKDVNDILNKYQLDYNSKAKIFALLNEKDSMYFYLNKLTKINQIITLNGMDEIFGKYANESKYKMYLEKHYLPTTTK